jgi:hypothetical protein
MFIYLSQRALASHSRKTWVTRWTALPHATIHGGDLTDFSFRSCADAWRLVRLSRVEFLYGRSWGIFIPRRPWILCDGWCSDFFSKRKGRSVLAAIMRSILVLALPLLAEAQKRSGGTVAKLAGVVKLQPRIRATAQRTLTKFGPVTLRPAPNAVRQWCTSIYPN